jgi:uncharacterized protein (TIGR03086 family)
MATLDLGPAAARLADLVSRVGDEQLGDPTPCPDYTVGALLDHIGGLAAAFANAAHKRGGELANMTGTGDATRLAPDWRTQVPANLDDLAAAWREPSAWTGMTRVGGVDLPGEVAGAVALDEIVLHGWDLARAIGHEYTATDREAEACLGFVAPSAEPGEEESRAGLFGAVVPVPPDAPIMNRLLGLSGRDPDWAPPRKPKT